MHCQKITLQSGQVRWECVGDGPADPVTGKRKQITRRAKTQKEAKKRVQDAIRSLSEDQIDESIAKRVTFDQVAARFLELYALTGKKRSSVRIREKEVKILNAHIGKVPITQIGHARYQQLINKLAPDYARTTLQGVNGCAGMVFKQAIKDKLIKENPQHDVVVPKKQRTVEEIESEPLEEKYLNADELEEFLQAVREHGLDLDLERFYLLAFSGMRSGELCALKWTDLDFETNEVRITKTLYNENSNMRNYTLTPPKTDGSIRVIEMEEEIMQLLKSHRKRQMKLDMKYRHEIEEYHDANFIFRRVNGYPFMQKNIVDRMHRLLAFTKIEKNATPHIFRHTHISMMTEAGVDLPTIMERVGHEDVQTTMKIYTHVTNKMKKDASAKVRTLHENALLSIDL